MSSPKTSKTPSILHKVDPLLQGITLVASDNFFWSPKDKAVFYNPAKLTKQSGQWSLLHEVSHAILDHQTYNSDFELLQLEVAAWSKAKQLSGELDITIDNNYIEDCLDTYRDWLHQRSTCPTCGNGGLQHTTREYRCHNCMTTWHVSTSRFCRPYRMKQITLDSKKSPDRSQTTFR